MRKKATVGKFLILRFSDPSRFVIPDDGYSMYSCSPATQGWQPLVNGNFEILGCVRSVPPSQAATGTQSVTVTSTTDCQSREKKVKDDFVKTMSDLRKTFRTLCALATCEDLRPKLNLNCGGARRRRRQTTATLSYSLPGGSASASALCSNIRSGTSTAGLTSCPTSNPTCAHGYILNDARTTCRELVSVSLCSFFLIHY